MLVDSLWDEIRRYLKEELRIVDYSVGVKYSYVIVEGEFGRAMGTAYFPLEDLTRGYSRVPKISILASMLSSTNIFERSLGTALLNSISQYLLWNSNHAEKLSINYGNIIEEIIQICKQNSKIAVIGNMVPLVSKLQEEGFKVLTFERNPRLRIRALPDSFAYRIIPEVDALIITGTTLINDTIDHLLALGRAAKIKALVGPTAAVYPGKALSSLTHIAALKIEDTKKVAEIIKLGGGRWDFAPYTKEYIIHIAKSK